jgi:hypothetical protein
MKSSVRVLPTILGLLLFSACANILEPRAAKETGTGETEIPAGKGIVRIDTGMGAARTALPTAVFDHYEYWFARSGGSAVKVDPAEGIFELEPGMWTVTVKAFAEVASDSLAAEGISDPFAISSGEDAGTIPVTVYPVVSEGTGDISYALTYPAGVTVNSFTLTLLAGVTPINLLTGATTGGTDPLDLTGSKTGLASGYYLARAALSKTANGTRASAEEVVHIYKNMSTELAWIFDEAYFTAIPVLSKANSGPGTLREAISNAVAGNTIFIDLPEDGVITLTSPLPEINKDLTIIGNGAVLTQSGFTANSSSQLLRISGSGTVRISRLHFKGGRAANYGAAIYNYGGGTLCLESCIFSGNETSAFNTYVYGGAIYNSDGTLFISGCTFYNNKSNAYTSVHRGYGGAIYNASGTLTLMGNIFWGNTATSGNVVYNGSSANTGGYNVSDRASGTDAVTGSGWTFANGDKQVNALPMSGLSFKPLQGSDALNLIDTLPADYPQTDFYGIAIPAANAAAGAVQTAVTGTGYYLDYGSLGPGTVSVISADADGIYTGTVTLEAEVDTGYAFHFWTIDGARQGEQIPATRLALSMDAHKTVRAVFGRNIAVTNNLDSGAGSFRDALSGAQEGDRISLPMGGTITLSSPLPYIVTSLTIEGNGTVLTQNGASRLLLINGNGLSVTVRISRLHFKGGRADHGSAIDNYYDTLYLESCIFSENEGITSDSTSRDVAIHNYGTLVVLGCTFYNNHNYTNGIGGVISNYGTLTLGGNIFWGNGAAANNAITNFGDTVNTAGYNLSDRASGMASSNVSSGWVFASTDIQASVMPISGLSFKPLQGSAALNRIAMRPVDYPLTDFYGTTISSVNAASGAVQTAVTGTGHYLDYGPLGPGTVSVISGSADIDGLFTGPITLEAEADTGYTFYYWTINGVRQGPQTPATQLAFTMDALKTVRAQFGRDIAVTNNLDSGAGSFRDALSRAEEGDRISLPAGGTITLSTPLPNITTSLTIEGNGAVLTQNGFTASSSSQLLRIIGGFGVTVRVSRLHFTQGRAADYGAAIYNYSRTLYLESCVFSGNETSASNAYGGAIYNGGGTLFVSGCTFYNNKSSRYGGAIYNSSGTLTLTGNIFWGNTATSGNVVYGSTINTGGHNVSDKASGTDAVTGSGWTFANDDTQASVLPISGLSFKPLQGSTALNLIATLPADYPPTDFYGATIPLTGAASGAVQTVAAAGYYLDYGSLGSGTVNVISPSSNADGVYSGLVTLEAVPDNGHIFRFWTIDGVIQGPQTPSTQLSLNVDNHNKTVQAQFDRGIAVTSNADSGAGSFRSALGNAQEGDYVILPVGEAITLSSPLPEITKSLIIEGNGAVLTQNGFTISNGLLRISGSGVTVRISRLHFKGGRAAQGGAAITNYSALRLESCLFSGNELSGSNHPSGGAIYNTGTLTVLGCAFYNNKAGRGGGAFYNSGALTIRGNIFWGNSANYNHVIFNDGGTVSAGGYNVSDRASGTDDRAGSGWTFANGDIQASILPVSGLTFKPLQGSVALNRIATRPADYPLIDFYGTVIPTTNAAAGAAQTAVAGTGYSLDYGSIGPGAVSVISPSPNADGLYTGPVTLEAEVESGYTFHFWTVDGVRQEEQASPTQFAFAMDAHKTVRAQFGRDIAVNNADSGAGSFREALSNAQNWDRITLPAEGTITLTTPLPGITKSLTIEGNGAVLTQSGFTASSTSQLLRVSFYGIMVRIRGLHFKGGLVATNGGAINNSYGALCLESCIFSMNAASSTAPFGGAVYNYDGTLSISGCTFFNNWTGGGQGAGGAIFIYSGTLTLMGNIFFQNDSYVGSVLRPNSSSATVITGGYNVSDKSSTESGWSFATTDKTITTATFNTTTFRPLSANMNSGADGIQIVPANTPGFSATDFYGAIRTFPGAAGAVAFP